MQVWSIWSWKIIKMTLLVLHLRINELHFIQTALKKMKGKVKRPTGPGQLLSGSLRNRTRGMAFPLHATLCSSAAHPPRGLHSKPTSGAPGPSLPRHSVVCGRDYHYKQNYFYKHIIYPLTEWQTEGRLLHAGPPRNQRSHPTGITVCRDVAHSENVSECRDKLC